MINTPNCDGDWFEAHRPRLFAIAYRMLGSGTEAEDVVQEAFLRCQATAPDALRSPAAFLNTVVTRLCLNQLASARARRESYLGVWLPEPVLSSQEGMLAAGVTSPDHQAELHESISLAFLVLLEQLTPPERAVFLLREVFDYSYGEIAAMVEREEAACRQIFRRAKQHLAAQRPRFTATVEEHRQLLNQFMQAVGNGELEGLMQLLSEDVSLWADGGGKVRGAATRPVHGRAAVAQFVLASTRYLPSAVRVEVAEVNGQPAAVLYASQQPVLLIALEVGQAQVRAVRVIANPEKLRGL